VKKLAGLFQGIRYGAIYKVLQRTYKWGSQPLIKSSIQLKYGDAFQYYFGKKRGNDLMHACAGSMVGAGEVLLLPLDVLKIKAQVNPEALGKREMLELFRNEGRALYSGWNWTIARNVPGSFMLFGANSFVYTQMFGISGAREATFFQITAASIFGSICSLMISSPFDVVKTRIQNARFEDKRRGLAIVAKLIKQEGPGAFYKGIVPKLSLVGPKLVFGFTVAQWLIARIDSLF